MTPSRLIIATPVDGNPSTAYVSHRYHVSVRQLERAGAVILPAELCFADDLARGRSRCVWKALQVPEWDWLLWIDDDTAFDAQIVPRMVQIATEQGYDVLGAPYPRKRIPAVFPYKPHQAKSVSEHECIEVDWLAFGFVLTSRRCLQSMVEHYADLWFTDGHDIEDMHETVALFAQVMTPEQTMSDGKRYRELLGEDYSFCYRWRAMGGRVWMYVGTGSPLGHVGAYVYTGTTAELGRVR